MEHPMMTKAAKGLDAIRMLRCGTEYASPDDVASRMYYALYHACWAFLQSQDPPVPFDENPEYEGKANFYAHNKLEQKLLDFPVFADAAGDDWRRTLSTVRRNRKRADYQYEPVENWMVERVAEQVHRAINALDALWR